MADVPDQTKIKLKLKERGKMIVTDGKNDDIPLLVTDANMVSDSESESDDELASENILIINNSTNNKDMESSDDENESGQVVPIRLVGELKAKYIVQYGIPRSAR